MLLSRLHRLSAVTVAALLGTALLSLNVLAVRTPQNSQEESTPSPVVQPVSASQFERIYPAVGPELSPVPLSIPDLTSSAQPNPLLSSIVPNQSPTASYIALSKGLSIPVPQNIGFVFNIVPPDRPDFFLFGEQITPDIYPATLTHVLYPSLNSWVKDNAGRSAPSAAGAQVRVFVFSIDTDANLSNAQINNVKQADFTITKDFSDPAQITSYSNYNEFDTPDFTIDRGSFVVLIKLISTGSSQLSRDGRDFFFMTDIRQPSKAVISPDDGRSLTGVGVQVNNLQVDFPVLARVTLANTSVPPPSIEKVRFAKNKLSVFGKQLSLTGQLRINNKVVVPPLLARYVQETGRLRVQATQQQLNLKEGENEISFTEGKLTSASFRFKYSPK